MSKYCLYTDDGFKVNNSEEILKKYFCGDFYKIAFDRLKDDLNGYVRHHITINGVRLFVIREK